MEVPEPAKRTRLSILTSRDNRIIKYTCAEEISGAFPAAVSKNIGPPKNVPITTPTMPSASSAAIPATPPVVTPEHQDFLASLLACSPDTVTIVGKEIARLAQSDSLLHNALKKWAEQEMQPEEKGGKPEGEAGFIQRSCFMQETSGVALSSFRGFPSGGSTLGPGPRVLEPSLRGYRGESDSSPRECSAFTLPLSVNQGEISGSPSFSSRRAPQPTLQRTSSLLVLDAEPGSGVGSIR